MVSLGANAHDLVFSFSVAERVASGFDAVASLLDGQASIRASYTMTASHEFRGYFSELFTSNMSTAMADSAEVASALRDVAQGVRDIAQAAREENERRRAAREYVTKHDNWWEKTWDFFFGQEPPPRLEVNPAPQIQSSAPPSKPRETPDPGSVRKANTGVSSASPSDLRSAANGLSGLDSSLSGKPGQLESYLEDFESACQFGSLDAGGVVSSLRIWLKNNDGDVSWLRTIADAFERFGSEGVVSAPNSALTASLQSAGIQASRSDITVTPATISGIEPTTGYMNDPVNAATGNFVESEKDLAVGDVSFTRTYNSIGDHESWFGCGWFSVLDERLVVDESTAIWFRDDGHQTVFSLESGIFGRGERANWWLDHVSVPFGHGIAEYTLTDNAGHRRLFDANGLLLGFDYDCHSAVVYAYDDAGRVVSIMDSRGRGVFVYYDIDRVVSVVATDGRRVTYAYENNFLQEACGAFGVRRYMWNDGLIAKVISASGVVEVENTYDAAGRVSTQKTPAGRTIRFAYLPGRVTSTSDADGTKSDTWVSDKYGRLVKVIDSQGGTQSMVFDRYGNMIQRISRSGRAESTFYNERGLVYRHINALGGELTFQWDDHDRLTTLVNPNGGVYALTYVGDTRRIESVTDPRGGVTRLRWENNRLREVRDAAGVAVYFSFDDAGDLVGMTDGLGNTTTYVRDDNGYLVAEISPRGGRKEYVYDDAGRLEKYTDAVGNTWRYTWQHDVLIEFMAPDGGVTRLEYDNAGQLISATDPLGHTSHRTYDELGNVVGIELPDGAKVAFTYDSLSRNTRTVDADGYSWLREYTPDGMLHTLTDPRGGVVSSMVDYPGHNMQTSAMKDGRLTADPVVNFDNCGRVTSVSNDDDKAIVVYDECGNPVERLLSDGTLWRYEYDLAGRLTARIDPENACTSYLYDQRGKLSTIGFSDGTWVEYTYNEDGQLSGWSKADGSFERFDYDLAGKLIKRVSSARGAAIYEWNRNGKIVYARDGWSGDRRYTYDLAGNLVQVRNALGGITRFSYDDRNRLIRTVFPDGRVETREYNGRNRMTSLSINGSATTASYDAFGRIERVTDPLGHVTTLRDDNGVVTTSVDSEPVCTVTVSSDGLKRTIVDHIRGSQHTMAYDRRGRLIEHSVDGRATSWEYTSAGRRIRQTAPNGDITNYSYDAAGRLIAIEHTTLGHIDFTYNDASQIASMVTPYGRHEWIYHDGAVASHTRVSARESIATKIVRDEARRISSIETAGDAVFYGYDAAGQLALISGGGATTELRYDECGRLMSESRSGDERSYSYNSFGQLASLQDNGRVVDFVYDAAGRRVGERDGAGRETGYTWDKRGYLSAIVEENTAQRVIVDALGNPVKINGTDVTWDTALAVAQPIQEGEASILPLPGGALYGDGEIISWRSSRPSDVFDPWQVSAIGSVVTSTGSAVIGDLELLGVRAFDSRTRSFLSMDTLAGVCDQAAGINSYSYAYNSPLAYIDPWGMRPATDADLDVYTANLPGSKWEYVAGAALVAGGIAASVFMGPIAGAVVGGFLISAGISTITQKWSTGSVDPTQVLLDGAIGAVSGLAGGAAGGAVTKFAQSQLTSAFGARVLGYSADAFTGSVIDTTATALTTPGYSASDFGRDLFVNTSTGLVFSTLGGEISYRMDMARTVPDVASDIDAAQALSITNDVPLAETTTIPQSVEPRAGEGIVYLRTDPAGEIKPYVGRSKSPERFEARQSEHMRAYDGLEFRYDILESGLPEDQLSRYEEYHIRDLGGPTNKTHPNGGLSNKRHEMSDKRYMEAGGSPYGE